MYWRNILGLESIKEDEGRIFRNNNPDKYTVGKSESPDFFLLSPPQIFHRVDKRRGRRDKVKCSTLPLYIKRTKRNVWIPIANSFFLHFTNLRIVSYLTLLDLRLESIFVARDRRGVLYQAPSSLPPLTVDVRLRIRRNSKVRDICCPRTYFNIVLSHAAYNPQGFAVHMFVPCKLSSKCSIFPLCIHGGKINVARLVTNVG